MTTLDTTVLADTVAEHGWPTATGALDVAAESVLIASEAAQQHPDCTVRAAEFARTLRHLAQVRTEVAAGIARHERRPR